jgi:anti-anti-sigma factor
MEKFRYISEMRISQKGNVVIVSLPKYFYIGNIAEIEANWDRLLDMSPGIIAFDCTQLEFIDSSAIGTLVKFFNSSAKNKVEMYVYGLKDGLLKIFDTTKINRIMTVMSAEDFKNKFLD